MTTIVYYNKQISYDSRITAGHIIHDDNCEKRLTHKGVEFFIAGTCGLEAALADAYFSGDFATDSDLEYDNEAIIYDKGNVFIALFDGENINISEQRLENCFAIGSGGCYAVAAIDQGAKTAALAVAGAMKRDTNTGGKIRTFNLKS
jgi:ATP-dependent protease HslVU (ClpYQ) peptidase subunit